jgi:hypothetical protein
MLMRAFQFKNIADRSESEATKDGVFVFVDLVIYLVAEILSRMKRKLDEAAKFDYFD